MVKDLQEIVATAARRNEYQYTVLKAVEELNELATVLTQHINKPTKNYEKEIIDEIGDVEIRVEMLRTLFDANKIDIRITNKLEKYKIYISDNVYKNI